MLHIYLARHGQELHQTDERLHPEHYIYAKKALELAS